MQGGTEQMETGRRWTDCPPSSVLRPPSSHFITPHDGRRAAGSEEFIDPGRYYLQCLDARHDGAQALELRPHRSALAIACGRSIFLSISGVLLLDCDHLGLLPSPSQRVTRRRQPLFHPSCPLVHQKKNHQKKTTHPRPRPRTPRFRPGGPDLGAPCQGRTSTAHGRGGSCCSATLGSRSHT